MPLPPRSTPPSRPPRRRRSRAALATLLGLVIGLLGTACLPPLVEPPTSGRNFGEGPLDAVYTAAEERASCGLTPIQLAAMMMAPTYTEAGGPVPSPMALSRWDNLSVSASNANLFAFGRTSGAHVGAFFSPGIGMWQFDSAGGWPFSAAGAIDTVTSANQAATTISYRWCNAPGSVQGDAAARRKYAWGPWYGCSTVSTCETIYASLVAGDRMNTAFDPSVTRYGGMQQRTCNLAGVGDGLTCWYVNPANAQGSKGWTGGTYTGGPGGVTPLPKPFYVIEHQGREHRVWIPADTGYDIAISGSKPVTANARTSLTWSSSPRLCDVTARRGVCDSAVPFGSFDSASAAGPERVRVQGWAIDPDTTSSIQVHVYVDGVGTATVARTSRPDVGAAHPGYGDAHGFDVTVPAGVGSRTVCAYAIDASGTAGNPLLGCRTVNVTGQPVGSLDVADVLPGAVSVAGWITVPGDPSAQAVISVDGKEAARFSTGVPRSDVQAAVAGAGPTAGFSGTVEVPGGSHRVCLTAGGAPLDRLGCRTVSVPTGPPVGSIDTLATSGGTVTIAGWAIDPDTADAIQVHVYVGGTGHALVADQRRDDVGAVFPPYGARHGFRASLPAPAGRSSVCAYAINVGGGSNTLLGCRTVDVPTGQPFGSLDGVSRTPGGVAVSGWAIDPDTTGPVQVHVYVGPAGHVLLADANRADVGAAFPASGPRHGFSATLPAGASPVSVCAYAINAAAGGGNVLLGCRTV